MEWEHFWKCSESTFKIGVRSLLGEFCWVLSGVYIKLLKGVELLCGVDLPSGYCRRRCDSAGCQDQNELSFREHCLIYPGLVMWPKGESSHMIARTSEWGSTESFPLQTLFSASCWLLLSSKHLIMVQDDIINVKDYLFAGKSVNLSTYSSKFPPKTMCFGLGC